MYEAPAKLALGTFGELYTQLRLWQYGVDTGRYLLDTGTDLVAASVNGRCPVGVQVKASASFPTDEQLHKLHPIRCPLLAWVSVPGEPGDVNRYFQKKLLDDIRLFLVPENRVPHAREESDAYLFGNENLEVFRDFFGEPAPPK